MRRLNPGSLLATLVAAMSLLAGSRAATAAGPADVNARRMLDPAATAANWMSYGGTYSEQHFSPLTQINKDNVSRLGLAWFADYDTNLTQAGTPLEIDGVIYVSTAWSKVYAFDARTGRTLWQYDPKTPGAWIRNVCCGIVNRGIAAWNGKIYLGTLDGRLVAIDAATGKEVWSVLTIDPSKHYSITVAPRVAKGKVLIGESGGEYGVRGYISAYDAETGKLDWRFYTIPGNPRDGFENEAMRKAAKTWGGEWWKLGGGGTVWDSIVFDPVTNLVYFGVGNGTPWNDRYRDPSNKDNLFLASIVALNVDTGQYVWHYQETPADTWDYDAVSPLAVVDMKFHGTQRRVLLQPSKNGFFYVIEASTGKLLNATPFVDVNWADGVDLKTGRPRTRPEARYPEGKPINLSPGVQGAHGWHANAYSPLTGLLYVPTQIATFPMVFDPTYTPNPVGYNLGIDFGAQFTYYREHPEAVNKFVGYLQAIDPQTGRKVWGGPENQGPTGGAVATAGGVVFQGGGTSNEFRAFDATSGKVLWTAQTQTAVLAAPITYEVDGKQYVAVSVGGPVQGGDYYAPNHSRMLVYALGGTAQLPAPQPYTPRALLPPAATATAEQVQRGEQLYARNCAACHGDRGQTRGANFPDLTRTPLLWSQEGFDAIVLKGLLAARGMASFAEALQPADSALIRAFIIDQANQLKNNPQPGAPPAAVGAHEQH
ncbi:MAG TPA: PQQ-dependent dehydrogenase, methanol/ethanol family [Steroidobacteraceae bacterium]|nr:PQQ-dependent dehydrogenase, methanol/ethanol family [Steroidobacteraceae bacterium]